MKKKLFVSLTHLAMRLTIVQIILISSVFSAYATDAWGQEVLNKKISIAVNNTELKSVLEKVHTITDVKFVFSPSIINVRKKITFSVQDRVLSEVLTQYVEPLGIGYRAVGNLIILYDATDKEEITKISTLEAITQADKKSIDRDITGVVLNEKSEPVAGASVLIQGTKIGTTTDIQGRFRLSAPGNGRVIIEISSVGYQTQTLQVNANTSSANIKLLANIGSMNEVVVIGYGQQRRAEVTASVATVQAKDFVTGPVQDAAQLLKGKVAGLNISNPSGDPNAQSQIQLRGTNSINGSTRLLYIVDGVPVDNLNSYPPEDIAEISVLKDGSAAAIYGVRGTNGVILITTKRASGNNLNSIDYNGNVSTTQFYRLPPLMTAEDYRKQIAEGTRPASYDLGSSTNWVKALEKKFPISNVQNISFKGGNAQTNYLAAFSYRHLDGPIQTTYNKQVTGRADINHSMLDGKLKFNMGILQTNFNGQGFNTGGFQQAIKMNPTAPVKWPDGTFYQEPTNFEYQNPISDLYNTDRPQTSSISRFNASITVLPAKGLRLSGTGSYQKRNFLNRSFENFQNISNIRDNRSGYAQIDQGQTIDRFLNLNAQYSKTFGNHSLTLLGGYEYQQRSDFSSSMNNRQFSTDQFGYSLIQQGAGLALGRAGMSSSQSQTNLISYFSRLTYNYQEKYLLMASLRVDGASQFYGAKDPWGTFPSVSVGWRMTKESFMQGQQFFDDLKFRGGYGVTGNPPNASFLGVGILGYGNNFLYNGNWIQTLGPVQNANPNLRWEEKRETNLGLDFSILKGLVTGSIDLYQRKVVGLLYTYTVPSPPNQFTSTLLNVGTMKNKGIEILVSASPIRKKDLNWTTSATFSTNANKLESLSNETYKVTVPYFTTGATGPPVQTFTNIVEVGHRIGDFFGFKVTGVSPTGEWIYMSPDGKTVPYAQFAHAFNDKQRIGNGVPRYYASWNHDVRYKNWDFSVVMRGAFDFQVVNFFRMYSENTSVQNYNRSKAALEPVFGTAVLNKLVPIELNSYYVEDGDFWKIDNISLGYTFTKLKSKYIRNPRIYVSTLNTFIITKYKGIDPEVPTAGLAPGVDDRNTYPATRTYTIGVSASF